MTGPGVPLPTELPSRRTTGITKVVALVMNASVAARASASEKVRSSMTKPCSFATSSTTLRVIPARISWPRWRRQQPVFGGHDVRIVGRPLRHAVCIDEPGVVGTGIECGLLGHRCAQQADRLDVTASPANVWQRHDREATLGKCRIDNCLRLTERHNGWYGVSRKREIARRGTAADLQVDNALGDSVSADELADNRQPLGAGVRFGDANLSKRSAEPAKMRVEIHQLAVQYRDDFVDRICKQKSAIEDTDAGIFGSHPATVDENLIRHRTFPFIVVLQQSMRPSQRIRITGPGRCTIQTRGCRG